MARGSGSVQSHSPSFPIPPKTRELMRLGLEKPAARLKKREEREMGARPYAGDPAESDGTRSPETTSLAASYAASPLAHKAAALWHHASDAEMGGASWRDVIGGGGDSEPPTVTPTPASSKRKKTKKEIFICHEPNCGKQFPRSFALRRHMRIHTGTKPYACDYDGCTQRFNTSGNLSRHKRIHSGERPYPCIFSTCGKKFNTSTKLKRHMRIHFPEGQNVFRCVGLNCAWSCDNYKEFAAHQKLQHNIIVGAGLEAVSAAAAAAIAAATGNIDHGNGDRSPQYDQSAEQTYGGSSNGYLYGYAKQPTLPPPSSSSSQSSRKLASTSSHSSSSSGAYYDNGFSSLSGLARDTKKNQDADHLYGDHARRPKPTNGYTLPSSFPPADVSSHYGSRSGSGLSSMYESSGTLSISSESSSYGAPSHRSGVFAHTLRHDEGNFKNESEGGQYEHQPHPHASPAHHHILRPPPPSHHDHDGMKFAVPPPMNPAAPEFTGEELSVVLELMKDSYY